MRGGNGGQGSDCEERVDIYSCLDHHHLVDSLRQSQTSPTLLFPCGHLRLVLHCSVLLLLLLLLLLFA